VSSSPKHLEYPSPLKVINIYGLVTDQYGNPVHEAMVNIAGWSDSTHVDGRFQVAIAHPGICKVEVRKSGFKPHVGYVNFSSDRQHVLKRIVLEKW